LFTAIIRKRIRKNLREQNAASSADDRRFELNFLGEELTGIIEISLVKKFAGL
jgi:hypothetical protein